MKCYTKFDAIWADIQIIAHIFNIGKKSSGVKIGICFDDIPLDQRCQPSSFAKLEKLDTFHKILIIFMGFYLKISILFFK
jgi:hypothetical protein